jgi:indoleamine 2,3-dioxygenase
MEIVNVLPNPPLFFRLFLRLALSLLNSTLNTNYCSIAQDKRPPTAFDLDPRTGFFPPRPLPELPFQFAIWEDALRDARGNLSLGEDDSEDAVAKRPFGQRWRSSIVAVCVICFTSSISNS